MFPETKSRETSRFFLQSVIYPIGFNLGKALLIKEHGYAIIYAKTVMPWSLDYKFLAMRSRMTEQ